MKTSEANIMQICRLEASRLGATLFRNNQGAYKHPKGYFIRYGICNPGGSDSVGWFPVTITPEMVGKKIAVFTALEYKAPGKKPTLDQQNFIDQVNKSGGIAGVIFSTQDVRDLLESAQERYQSKS